MEFNEALQQLEQFKDTDEYKTYFGGLSKVTPEGVKEYLSTEDGKKLIQPDMDKFFTKGLETWKTNNLDKLINDEIQKRNPSADPKDIELANMKAQLESIQREALRKDLTNKALKIANEKRLPTELIDYFIGEDEDATTNNIKTLEKIFNTAVSSSVDNKIKENTHVPPAGRTEPLTGVEQAFQDITGLKITQ
jgi:hypothetical protein